MVQDVNLTSREWCDIIFEGKNKKYGAYYLRKTSNRRHLKALLAVIILVAVVVVLPFIIESVKPNDKEVEVEVGETTLSDLEQLKKQLPEDKVIEEFKAPPPPEVRASIQFVPPVIVEKVTKETEIPPTEEIVKSTEAIATQTVETGNNKGQTIDELEKVVIPTPEKEEDKIFRAVEQQPQFPGGQSELMKYLSNNLKYPPAAAEQGIQGRVVVQFVVSKNGAISDVKVLQPLHPSCDKEAVRLISSMPKWIPGKQNGNPVNVYYTIPIRFKLQEQ
ncbi:MAG: TonB family protein [Candidatus Azobacteroides sp.]|nr:TonB family protein [Candidatus Azobacteroides sp.]